MGNSQPLLFRSWVLGLEVQLSPPGHPSILALSLILCPSVGPSLSVCLSQSWSVPFPVTLFSLSVCLPLALCVCTFECASVCSLCLAPPLPSHLGSVHLGPFLCVSDSLVLLCL